MNSLVVRRYPETRLVCLCAHNHAHGFFNCFYTNENILYTFTSEPNFNPLVNRSNIPYQCGVCLCEYVHIYTYAHMFMYEDMKCIYNIYVTELIHPENI